MLKNTMVVVAMVVGSAGVAVANDGRDAVVDAQVSVDGSGESDVQAYCYWQTYCDFYGYCWTNWVCF